MQRYMRNIKEHIKEKWNPEWNYGAYRVGINNRNLSMASFYFLWVLSSNSVSVAHIIIGSDKGIGERLYKMWSLIINMKLVNRNSLFFIITLELDEHKLSLLHSDALYPHASIFICVKVSCNETDYLLGHLFI